MRTQRWMWYPADVEYLTELKQEQGPPIPTYNIPRDFLMFVHYPCSISVPPVGYFGSEAVWIGEDPMVQSHHYIEADMKYDPHAPQTIEESIFKIYPRYSEVQDIFPT